MDAAPNNPLVFTEHQLIASIRKPLVPRLPKKHEGIHFFLTMDDFEKARRRSLRTRYIFVATITVNVRMTPSCYWEFLETGKLSLGDVFISAADFEKITAINAM
ncbi:MAG TPA: hypothetical protein VJ579_01035 [Candidatus Paceibacterota bacterium]|nr:hypothetical protein [Candidatus Paceibacterota bacterium]